MPITKNIFLKPPSPESNIDIVLQCFFWIFPMDMYGYGTTKQGNYFYFQWQYKFFLLFFCFFPCFSPFLKLFFSMAGSPMKFWKCRRNADKWRMWGWDTSHTPLATSLNTTSKLNLLNFIFLKMSIKLKRCQLLALSNYKSFASGGRRCSQL